MLHWMGMEWIVAVVWHGRDGTVSTEGNGWVWSVSTAGFGGVWSVALVRAGVAGCGQLHWDGLVWGGWERIVARVRMGLVWLGLLKGVPPQAIAQGDDSLRGLGISLLCLLCHCVWLVFTNHPAHIRQSLESGNRELTIRL